MVKSKYFLLFVKTDHLNQVEELTLDSFKNLKTKLGKKLKNFSGVNEHSINMLAEEIE